MNWKTRLGLLLILAIPAFTGYPLKVLTLQVPQGIGSGWWLYFLIANIAIGLIMGKHRFTMMLGIAVMISLPVVFGGAAISFLIHLAGLSDIGPLSYSIHYVSLCITMLTVIPLALALMMSIPFHRLEQHLLAHERGVSQLEKSVLMAMRVFNHVVFFVIPDILEVLREEQIWLMNGSSGAAAEAGLSSWFRQKRRALHRLITAMIQLAVEGICASVQYIPLWAVEIAKLPNRETVEKS